MKRGRYCLKQQCERMSAEIARLIFLLVFRRNIVNNIHYDEMATLLNMSNHQYDISRYFTKSSAQ